MSLVTAAPEAARRHALVIGTAIYAPGWPDIADGVLAEVAAARHLLLDGLGYQRKTFGEILDPNESTLKGEVARWRASIAPSADDWLLVYYTGHGVERAGMLNLITTDIAPNLTEVAPSAQSLVSALLGGECVPRHVLLVLDTCHSGTAHLDTATFAARLREAEGGAVRGADFHVVATARSIGLAYVGRFMQALSTVITTGAAAGPDEEFVQPSVAIEQVNRMLGARGDQRASYSGAGESALRFLPNPGWLPHLRVNMERETRAHVLHRIQSQALHGHWGPRARGVANERDVGWFFTGRAQALRHLVAWLSNSSGGGGLVVKGLQGSGKSALLARIATLSDRHERTLAVEAGALEGIPVEELPPLDGVDVAIHARAKDPAQMALELAAALGLDLSDFAGDAETATTQALARRAAQTVIIVDALDEAVRPADCATFLRALLRKATNVRLLVGVRESAGEPGRLSALLGPGFTTLDLDAAQWRDSRDMSCYVERYLRAAPRSPYVDAVPSTLRQLAEAIAARAGTSFLVASATANALAARGETVDPAALDPLPATVGEAFALDLARFEGSAGEQLRCVLTALACGEGRGLPAAEWLVISQALSDGDVSAEDLDRWSRDAAFYIVLDEEFGTPVRRLYHEAFVSHLRPALDSGCYAAIADALAKQVPRSRPGAGMAWDEASTYVLGHYSKHLRRARRTQALSELVSSAVWIEAKRRRFGDLAPVLADLDLAVDLARHAQPPDLHAVLRGCATYTRFATTAPPLVIDVLAGLGQRARAYLMAEAIEFPLDRCQAFALLAVRFATAGDADHATACVQAAARAARAIHGHFATMALYWVVCAARATGQSETWSRVIEVLHEALQQMPWGQADVTHSKDAATSAGMALQGRSAIAARLWAADRWTEEDRTFAVPHWLFWAAMCMREIGDAEGLARLRDVLAGMQRLPTNLVLQTAAIAGDIAFLRTVRGYEIDKPGNVALALVEAGLTAEFDALREIEPLTTHRPADSRKRYAWALARRGDFDAALQVAAGITEDLEEHARALYLVARTAVAAADRGALQRVAAQAAGLRTLVSYSVDSWRVESWLAPVMHAAGLTAEASSLAESVCAAAIIPSRETSLAMATPRTARSKGHVQLESDTGPDEGLCERVLKISSTSGSDVALDYLALEGASAHSRATILARLANIEPDVARAYSLWLDALVSSRTAGRTTLRSVVTEGESILIRAADSVTCAALLAQLDAEFA